MGFKEELQKLSIQINERRIHIHNEEMTKQSLHDAQLCRYFNATQDVGLGIITNGIEYRFFTDLVNTNIMDVKPFLVVDMLNLKESDFENLIRFKKESFNKLSLIKYAEELVYTSSLDDRIKELLKNPDDEFVKYLIKDFDIQRITSNVLDKFRPIVKKSISNAVLDIVSMPAVTGWDTLFLLK